MKFRHIDLDQELIWTETVQLCELIIESPVFLRQVLRDLSRPSNEKKLSFLDRGEKIDEKNIDVIFNPLKLDFNNRRAHLAMLKMLVKTSLSEDFYLSTNKLKTKIIKYFDQIVDAENFNFEVAVTDNFNIDALAKAVNLHVIDDEDDLVELLVDYLTMMTELAEIKIFVFINLRSLLTDAEVERLHHDLKNHQIRVLLLENHARAALPGVNRILIDRDLCEL